MIKRVRAGTVVLTAVMVMSLSSITVNASSLDDVITNEQVTVEQEVESNIQETQNETVADDESTAANSVKDSIYDDSSLDYLQGAADLSGVDVKGADKINEGIKKVAAWMVTILSYFLTAFLVVRVLLDLTYIGLPFTRTILSNGYGGNSGTQQGTQMPGMGQMGMQGMRMGRASMGGMNQMGANPMTMNQGSQAGATPAMGRVQFVSNAALNAVAAEMMPGPDGKSQNGLKIYAKDMFVVLVFTIVLLVLAISGSLTNLGFLIGETIANGINSIGSMM